MDALKQEPPPPLGADRSYHRSHQIRCRYHHHDRHRNSPTPAADSSTCVQCVQAPAHTVSHTVSESRPSFVSVLLTIYNEFIFLLARVSARTCLLLSPLPKPTLMLATLAVNNFKDPLMAQCLTTKSLCDLPTLAPLPKVLIVPHFLRCHRGVGITA